MQIYNETILITGASSGIGRALAMSLAHANRVIAVGRHHESLMALASQSNNIQPLVFDVSDKSQIADVQLQLCQDHPHLDRIILNAGDCQYIEPDNIDWSVFERMMAVNFYGWLNTIELCLNLLKKSPNPHIVGIASQVTLAPFSKAAAYGASKSAASYLLKSLALDLHHLSIDVSLIHPGFVDTPLTQKNDFPMPFLLSTDDANERILNAITRRKSETSFPRRLRWILLLSKLMPELWLKKLAWKHSHA